MIRESINAAGNVQKFQRLNKWPQLQIFSRRKKGYHLMPSELSEFSTLSQVSDEQ